MVDETGVEELEDDELEVVLIVDDTGVEELEEDELDVTHSDQPWELELEEVVVTIDDGTELVVEFPYHSAQEYADEDEEEVVVITAGVDDVVVFEEVVVVLGTWELVVYHGPQLSCGFATAAPRAMDGSRTAASAEDLERECIMQVNDRSNQARERGMCTTVSVTIYRTKREWSDLTVGILFDRA